MKNIFLFFIPILFISCKKDVEVGKEEKVDWNKSSIILMNELRPKLYGSWKIEQMHITPYAPNTSEIGIFKDTLLNNVAELTINQVNNVGYYEKGNDVTGTLKFKTKSYPVGFRMLPTGEQIFQNKGAHVFALFEYRFPVGTHLTEPEENYLYNLTLINDTFEIEMSKDGKMMTWRGLNRAIKSMQLVKKL